ncbi:uncharacterized protein LOC129592699 [Paramacrobiotus metropolitanus]|uniref:uncharacterized protein LOC129592699 n=1 Tax=Paramacrobiotus metropolitanus TaxID=2943436 RepID=UPI002445DC6A|nr:uncharacterized protein LOC129592699 [Paramacrobiotus metropolitanus]XP_055344774.1 uncharacterized protein LOC129592699 [Paramacrobiotus metropolitanus]
MAKWNARSSDRQDYLHGRLPKKYLYYRPYQGNAMTKLGERIDGVWEESDKKRAIGLHPKDLKESTKLRNNAQHRQNKHASEDSSRSSELPVPLTSAKRSTGTKSAASRKRRFSSPSADRVDSEDPKEGMKLRNDRQDRNSAPVSEISLESSELPVPLTQRSAITKPALRKRRFTNSSSDKLDGTERSSSAAVNSTPRLRERSMSVPFSQDLSDSMRKSVIPGDRFLVTVYNADGTTAVQVTIRGTSPPKITVERKSVVTSNITDLETEGAGHPHRCLTEPEVAGIDCRSASPPRDRSLDRAVSYLMSL